MTGRDDLGLVLDLGAGSGPAPVGAAGWREGVQAMGGWWGVLRYLPGAFRQVLSGREPAGGLPVAEPGQARPAGLGETDFNPGAPVVDHAPAAEAGLAAQLRAEAAPAQAGFEAGTSQYVADSEHLAQVDDAAGAGQGVPGSVQGAVQDLSAGPYTADVSESSTAGSSATGFSVAEAGAELGEAGLEAAL